MVPFLNFIVIYILSIGVEDILSLSVENAFEKYDLVPEVLENPPETLLYVKYPDGAVANLGNKLTPDDTVDQPIVQWTGAESGSLYTLVMLDPDAPSRKNPTRRNWLHWLVGNIPGRTIFKGHVMATYNGPTPPRGTGAHRYVFLVYKQKQQINFQEVFPDLEKGRRGGFRLHQFVTKYGLGNPIAGNFFQALPHSY